MVVVDGEELGDGVVDESSQLVVVDGEELGDGVVDAKGENEKKND